MLFLVSGKTMGLPTAMDVGAVVDRRTSPEAYWSAFAVWTVVLTGLFGMVTTCIAIDVL